MMNLEDLKPGVSYTHEQVKHLVPDKLEGREQRGVATTWEELTESHRAVFSMIARKIREITPDVKILASGSRVWGYWKDDSDYDIVIEDEDLAKYSHLQFPVKVDMRFSWALSSNGILIP